MDKAFDIKVRAYEPGNDRELAGLIAVWNQVVAEGSAFPQEELLNERTGAEFFGAQSYTAAALGPEGEVWGLYILHPNNLGRCGHIANASYAVAEAARGRGVGEALVRDSLSQGRRLGFRILQFNAVVATNRRARELYERLGFVQLGVIPGGFRLKDGTFEDICPYYHIL